MDEELRGPCREFAEGVRVSDGVGASDGVGVANAEEDLGVPQGAFDGEFGHRGIGFDHGHRGLAVQQFPHVVAEPQSNDEYGAFEVEGGGIDESGGFFSGVVSAVEEHVSDAQGGLSGPSFNAFNVIRNLDACEFVFPIAQGFHHWWLSIGSVNLPEPLRRLAFSFSLASTFFPEVEDD